MQLTIKGDFFGLQPGTLMPRKKVLYISGDNEEGKSRHLDAIKACFGYSPRGIARDRWSEVFGPRSSINLKIGDLEVVRTRTTMAPIKSTLLTKLGITGHALDLIMDQEGIIQHRYLHEILASVSTAQLDLNAELINKGCDGEKVKEVLSTPYKNIKEVGARAANNRAKHQQAKLPEMLARPERMALSEVENEIKETEDLLFDLKKELEISASADIPTPEQLKESQKQLPKTTKSLSELPEPGEEKGTYSTDILELTLSECSRNCISEEEYSKIIVTLKENKIPLEIEIVPSLVLLEGDIERLDNLIASGTCSTCKRTMETAEVIRQELVGLQKELTEKQAVKDKIIAQNMKIETLLRLGTLVEQYENLAELREKLKAAEQLNRDAEDENAKRTELIEKREILQKEKNDLNDLLNSQYHNRSTDLISAEAARTEEQLQQLKDEKTAITNYDAAEKIYHQMEQQNLNADKEWQAWDKIIKACGTLENAAVVEKNPLQNRIEYTSGILGMPVTVNGTMIKYEDRKIDLASKSAQWRVALLIYEAICHLYKFPMFMIDEAGINSQKYRMLLNRLIAAVKNDYEQVIVCQTSFVGEKAPSADHPWAEKKLSKNGAIIEWPQI